MMIDVRAEAPLQRWLDFLEPRGHARFVHGERYERGTDRLWYRREWRPDEHAGRRPDLSVDADRYAEKVTPYTPSQGDVDDALKGLPPTPVVTPEGVESVEYRDIPLKHADGSLTRYAKNLIDLHAPAARAGASFAGEVVAGMDRAEVERADGRPVALPVREVEPLLKSGRVREKKKRRRVKR